MDAVRDLAAAIDVADDGGASPDAGQAAVEAISDRYLFEAINACCSDHGRLLVPQNVRDLIARYGTDDRSTAASIRQQRRRAFLEELAQVTGRPVPPRINVLDEIMRLLPGTSSVPEPVSVSPGVGTDDAELIENGYEPIAVKGKAPVAAGWNKRANTIEALSAERAENPDATNTGLRTGHLVGVDIDIVPTEHVREVKRLAAKVLGDTPLERVGAKGAMLCYRNETSVKKITISARHPAQPGKVEILGTGQQFVAYGIHPDTGKPYSWPNASVGGEPLQTTLAELPEVTPEKLVEFAERAVELLEGLGYTDIKLSGRGDAPEPVRLDAPPDLDLDSPADIERARQRLRVLIDRDEVAVEGHEGDKKTYTVACMLRDLGLSAEKALKMLLEPRGWNAHCRPPWGPDELAIKVRNAYRYAQNAPGAEALPADLFEPLEGEAAGASDAAPAAGVTIKSLVERFRGRWPDEYEALAELKFWDADRLLPRSPDGCIAIVYGEFGAHKTNTVLAMVLDAILSEDARVTYAAGEGVHGVGKQRIPAHCAARGITTPELRERLCIVSAVPQFISPEEVAAFIEAQKDFKPDIVVLDTLATAIAGEDENSSKAAAFLTANGPAGRIRDAFKALVILLAHQGCESACKKDPG